MSKRKAKIKTLRDMGLSGLPRSFYGNNPAERRARLSRGYLDEFRDLSASRFEWKGMPEEINVRYLEEALYWLGLAVFFKDSTVFDDKYLCMKAGRWGVPNIYDEPTEFSVSHINYQRILDIDECVPIWCSHSRIPKVTELAIFADRLAELDISIDLAIINSRHPVLLAAEENTQLSLENAYRQIQEGQPFITTIRNATTQETMADLIQSFDLGVNTSSIADLQIAKTRLYNDVMTRLGIDNANQDKKERLVAAEIDANADQVSLYRTIQLKPRRLACEQINAMFHLNVSVDWVETETGSDEPSGDSSDDGNDREEDEDDDSGR